MTTKELLQTKISYYSNIKYNTSYKQITLYDWISKYSMKNKTNIDKIRELYDTNKDLAKQMKADNLPAVTITGVFDSYRRVDLVSKINPIIAIDIDRDDNTHIKDWEELKCTIAKLPYVFLTSYSCSGKGIYCLIYFNTELNFEKMFYSLECDFKELSINIDKNCKDITRLRFISYDNTILIRQNEVQQYNKEKEKPIELVNKEYKESRMLESDAFIYKAIYYLIVEDKYRTDSYSSWLQNGFYLSTFNQYGYLLFLLLSQLSNNYDREKAIQQFKECQKRTRYNKDCLVFYFGILKQIHGSNWKQIIKDYIIK